MMTSDPEARSLDMSGVRAAMASAQPGQGLRREVQRSSGQEDIDAPTAVRQEVIARDQGFCRLCGMFQGYRGCRHHIVYRSQGGLDVVLNLVTLGWLPGSCCCHQRAHSHPEWRELLLEVVLPENAGATALQLRRWRGRGRVTL
jgi:hypothetical protein